MKSVLKKIGLMIVLWAILWLVWLFVVQAIPSSTYEKEYTNESGETYTESEIKDSWASAGGLVALCITLASLIIVDYNRLQPIKASIPGLKNDVLAYEEKRAHQIDQANRVLDKYLSHEKSVQEASAASHVNNGAQFTAVLESHPELKANQAIETLMTQINQVETELVRVKSALNNCVAEYNAAIHTFPLVVFRKLFKLEDIVVETKTAAPIEEAAVTDEDLGI
ncbi:MAG: LemA family protein [Pseudobutyrivibrio sp.]|nr:LemA family protein [Pseudobutyrivibrio sp.]